MTRKLVTDLLRIVESNCVTWRLKDRACPECMPDGGALVKADYRCTRHTAKAFLEAAQPVRELPCGAVDGWQWVPVEPSFEMLCAVSAILSTYPARAVWTRMLEAAPAAPGVSAAPPTQGAMTAALEALKTAESEMRDWHFEHPARKQITAAIELLKHPDDGKSGDWYCEDHPEHLMGHDGCTGAGIPECARISMLARLLKISRQAEREANTARDEMAAHARRLAAPPTDAQDAKRYRWLRDKSEPGICAFYLSVGHAFKGVRFVPATVDAALDDAISREQPDNSNSNRLTDVERLDAVNPMPQPKTPLAAPPTEPAVVMVPMLTQDELRECRYTNDGWRYHVDETKWFTAALAKANAKLAEAGVAVVLKGGE